MADEISNEWLQTRQSKRAKAVEHRLQQIERTHAAASVSATARTVKAERVASAKLLAKLRSQEKRIVKDMKKSSPNVVRRAQLESSLRSVRLEIERLAPSAVPSKLEEPLVQSAPVDNTTDVSAGGDVPVVTGNVCETLPKKHFRLWSTPRSVQPSSGNTSELPTTFPSSTRRSRRKRNSKADIRHEPPPDFCVSDTSSTDVGAADLAYWASMANNPDFQMFFTLPTKLADIAEVADSDQMSAMSTDTFAESAAAPAAIVGSAGVPVAVQVLADMPPSTIAPSHEIVPNINDLPLCAEVSTVDCIFAEPDNIALPQQLEAEQEHMLFEHATTTPIVSAIQITPGISDDRLSMPTSSITKDTDKQVDAEAVKPPFLELPSTTPSPDNFADIRRGFRKARKDRADIRAARRAASEMDQRVAQRDVVESLSSCTVKKVRQKESAAVTKTLNLAQRDTWIRAKVDGTPTTPLTPVVDPARQAVRSHKKDAKHHANSESKSSRKEGRKADKEARAAAVNVRKQTAAAEKLRHQQEHAGSDIRHFTTRKQGQSLRKRFSEFRSALQSKRRKRAKVRHTSKVTANDLRLSKRTARATAKKGQYSSKPTENVAPPPSRRSRRLEKQEILATQKSLDVPAVGDDIDPSMFDIPEGLPSRSR